MILEAPIRAIEYPTYPFDDFNMLEPDPRPELFVWQVKVNDPDTAIEVGSLIDALIDPSA